MGSKHLKISLLNSWVKIWKRWIKLLKPSESTLNFLSVCVLINFDIDHRCWWNVKFLLKILFFTHIRTNDIFKPWIANWINLCTNSICKLLKLIFINMCMFVCVVSLDLNSCCAPISPTAQNKHTFKWATHAIDGKTGRLSKNRNFQRSCTRRKNCETKFQIFDACKS